MYNSNKMPRFDDGEHNERTQSLHGERERGGGGIEKDREDSLMSRLECER